MRVTEIIEEIREASPALLDRISPPRAEALVRNVFQRISSNLAGTEEGVVQYAGLGRFQIRKAASGLRIEFRADQNDNSQADGADD